MGKKTDEHTAKVGSLFARIEQELRNADAVIQTMFGLNQDAPDYPPKLAKLNDLLKDRCTKAAQAEGECRAAIRAFETFVKAKQAAKKSVGNAPEFIADSLALADEWHAAVVFKMKNHQSIAARVKDLQQRHS